MRTYQTHNGHPFHFIHKIEVTTEARAAEFADIETSWIYFQAELNT